MSLMQLSQVIGTANNVWSQLVTVHVTWLIAGIDEEEVLTWKGVVMAIVELLRM